MPIWLYEVVELFVPFSIHAILKCLAVSRYFDVGWSKFPIVRICLRTQKRLGKFLGSSFFVEVFAKLCPSFNLLVK